MNHISQKQKLKISRNKTSLFFFYSINNFKLKSYLNDKTDEYKTNTRVMELIDGTINKDESLLSINDLKF